MEQKVHNKENKKRGKGIGKELKINSNNATKSNNNNNNVAIRTVRHWPENVKFITHNLWDPKVPLALRQKYKAFIPSSSNLANQSNSKKWNKKARVQKIEEPNHPACGQYGLFAVCNLEPKSLVIDYFGVIRTEKDASQTSDYILKLDEELSVDAEEAGNEARFINDFRNTGSTANVCFENHIDEVTGETRIGVFVMTKPIKKGTELLVSYGKGFWNARKVSTTTDT